MKELNTQEVNQISGGDRQTYNWGEILGNGLRSAWDAMASYAASDESSTDVIV